MQNLNDDEIEFKKKIEGYKSKALQNNQLTLLKFLNVRYQEIVKYVIGKNCFLYFDGGYQNAENKRVIISSFEISNPDYKIIKIKLDYNKKFFSLTHQMVLGTIMSLGIKRECIGDIVIDNDDYFLMATSDISDYLMDNIGIAFHGKVHPLIYDGEIENQGDSYIEREIFVSSLRLDNVISGACNLSRNKSYQLITESLVKVNQSIILNSSHILNENDILSVRGYGRIKIIKILGKSRSDRYILRIGRL